MRRAEVPQPQEQRQQGDRDAAPPSRRTGPRSDRRWARCAPRVPRGRRRSREPGASRSRSTGAGHRSCAASPITARARLTSACWSSPRPRSAASPTPRRGWPHELADADVVAAEDTRRLRRLCRATSGVTVDGPGGVLLRGQRGRAHPVAGRGAARRRAGAAGHRRRDAQRVRPGLPAGRGRGRGRASGSPRSPGPRRCSPRWRSRGCRSTGSASRASCRARPGSARRRLADLAGRAAHDGLLRGAAPHRGGAGGDGRGVRRRPARRRCAAS